VSIVPLIKRCVDHPALGLACALCFCGIFVTPCSGQAIAADEIQETTKTGEVSIRELRDLATSGDAVAQRALGDLYEDGQLVLQDFQAALYWRKLAAEQGDGSAANAAGRQYAQGLGVTRDEVLAMQYLISGAKTGNPVYQYDLGAYLDGMAGDSSDTSEAFKWYEKAARQNLAEAQASVGSFYYQGRGVGQNFDKAIKWLSDAAAQGSARAQNNLGLMYVRGDGLEKDYEKAIEHFAAASASGLAIAHKNLAVMYENGFGVPVDDGEARRLYLLSAKGREKTIDDLLQRIGYPYDPNLKSMTAIGANEVRLVQRLAASGDPVARYMLAYALVQGVPGIDIAGAEPSHAIGFYESAARNGLTFANFNLGLHYLRGLLVPQDYAMGYMYINLAAGAGLPIALDFRNELFPHLSGRQINDARALAVQVMSGEK